MWLHRLRGDSGLGRAFQRSWMLSCDTSNHSPHDRFGDRSFDSIDERVVCVLDRVDDTFRFVSDDRRRSGSDIATRLGWVHGRSQWLNAGPNGSFASCRDLFGEVFDHALLSC